MWHMRILANPVKETTNRGKHGWGFERVDEIFGDAVLEEPDDRPLGHQHEGRVRAIGRIGMRVVFLVFEPVEMEDGELAVRPISLRDATRSEERVYWRHVG